MTYWLDKWNRGQRWAPKEASESGKCITIIDYTSAYPPDAEVETVAHVPHDTRPDGTLGIDYNAVAIAHLIAAAPQMLIALENVIPYIEAAIADDYVEGVLTDDAEGEVSRDLKEVKRIIRAARSGWR